MFELLTPLSKCTRDSLPIERTTFISTPGIWAYVHTDGILKNFSAGVVKQVARLILEQATLNPYESNQLEGDRVSALEPYGFRFITDNYVGTPSVGEILVISVEVGQVGKLRVLDGTMTPGVYPDIAQVEAVYSTYIIARSVLPLTNVGGVAPEPLIPLDGAIDVALDEELEWS
jgi:hypothetical protein